MKYFIIDTSSILFAVSFRKDAFLSLKEKFPEYKPAISLGVIRELKGIANNGGKHGIAARTALNLINTNMPKIYSNNGNVDKWIIGQSLKDNSPVMTNDTKLIKMLVANDINSFKISKSGLLRKCNIR